jgi:hypothetical protein
MPNLWGATEHEGGEGSTKVSLTSFTKNASAKRGTSLDIPRVRVDSGQKLIQDGCIREPETNFYVRILLCLVPFSPFLFETTGGNFYAKNSAYGFLCNLALQAEAEKFQEPLSD